MKRIILSFLVIAGAVSALAIGGTGAFFSDTETSTGNVFAAGTIDLKVDNESYYNGEVSKATSWDLSDLDEGHLFFNFRDLKPSDEGEDTISLHVDTNDAWACMNLALTANDDNDSTEPELLVDKVDDPENDWDGELAQNIEMFWWADDGDNVYEKGETTISDGVQTLLDLAPQGSSFSIPLADSQNNVWGEEGSLPGGETRYIAKAWCFGELLPDPIPQDNFGKNGNNGPLDRGTGFTCDGSGLGNETQTDQALVNISFRAIQSRHNSDFLCKPVAQCEPEQAYADHVVDSDKGVRKNGTDIALDRSDPLKALGSPQSFGAPFDNPVPTGEFFSLGFDKGLDETPNEGGWIIVEFTDNIIVDGPGNDLRVWEVTGGSSYPTEKVKIEVSQDGSTWFPVASSLDRDAEADLADSGLSWAKYVRLTDVSVRSEYESTADGYDLDAFSALNCEVTL